MPGHTLFARRIFLWSGIYGIAALLPQYLLEDRLARDFPPPLNHPEYFYGFVGVALAWQFAFIVISRDVVRFRPLMLPAAAEKFLFAASTLALYFSGRVAAFTAGAAMVDLFLGILFVVSYVRCSNPRA
ncbi:MAG: hypothetical protein EXS64_06450 [Candidatus Latescibacteria bacterium]|nr:hypothetical protein [Candidatus Latescibacterota bacterium]